MKLLNSVKAPLSSPLFRYGILFACAGLIVCSVSAKSKKPPSASVFTEVSKRYEREMLPSGRWKAETYAFAEGAMLDKGYGDESLNALSFRDMGEILSDALATEQYVPTTGAAETDLLLVVHWGKTLPGDDGMRQLALDQLGQLDSEAFVRENDSGNSGSYDLADESNGIFNQMMMVQDFADEERRKANRYNAKLLGYNSEIARVEGIAAVNPMFGGSHSELMYELESPRYFVILQAFDFQKMWKEKKQELLWVTKFSIRAKGRKFNEELAHMAASAAKHFGDETNSLKRFQRPSEVIFGDLEFLGVQE